MAIIAESVIQAIVWSQNEPPAVNLGVGPSQGYYLQQCVEVYTQTTGPYYGSLVNAENYFKTRLNTQQWDFAERDERVAALSMATRVMETLHYKGHKAVQAQPLFFPRTIDGTVIPCTCSCCPDITGSITDFTAGCNLYGFPPICPDPTPTGTPVIPGEIEVAAYEIALCFLNGFDPEIEARNLSVTSQGYAGARSSYDRTFIQDHLRAGVPSALAWSILRPYLADPQALRLTRGS